MHKQTPKKPKEVKDTEMKFDDLSSEGEQTEKPQ